MKAAFAVAATLMMTTASLTYSESVLADGVSVCVNKRTGAARFVAKCKRSESALTLSSLASGGSSTNIDQLTAEVQQLQNDVNGLKGIPAATPIGVFQNSYLKATVLGATKIVDAGAGTAYITASFQLQNIGSQDLYIGSDQTFSTSDNNGITTPGGIASGIKFDVSYGHLRGTKLSYSVVPPNQVIVIGAKSNAIDRANTAKLGNRFGFSFPLFHYLDIGLDTGDFETVNVGFSGIALSQ